MKHTLEDQIRADEAEGFAEAKRLAAAERRRQDERLREEDEAERLALLEYAHEPLPAAERRKLDERLKKLELEARADD
jgi:hypothetical protein